MQPMKGPEPKGGGAPAVFQALTDVDPKVECLPGKRWTLPWLSHDRIL